MTHRIDEIKRRLSVLENRIGINNKIDSGELLALEITRRLSAIKLKIEEKPSEQEKQLTESDMTKILQTLSTFEKQIGITGNKNPDAPPPKDQRELKYETNFIKSEFGNAIRTGTKMFIKIKGAKSVSAGIYKDKKLILASQSHKNDEDKNTETVSFLLKKRRKSRLGLQINLNPGTYLLYLWFWNQKTGKQGTYKDEFEIVP